MPVSASEPAAAREVLDFWFAGLAADAPPPKAVFARWFGKSEANDRAIAGRFAARVEQALRGELDGWAATPRGRLALIVLLDQFTRNLFRDSARAFSGDARALALAREAVAGGEDRRLDPYERVFLYLPLEHAEDLSVQHESLRAFEVLAAGVARPLRETFDGFLDYARRHAVIIERFGRFPHRNRALGRASTAAEEAFLREPGSSF